MSEVLVGKRLDITFSNDWYLGGGTSHLLEVGLAALVALFDVGQSVNELHVAFFWEELLRVSYANGSGGEVKIL